MSATLSFCIGVPTYKRSSDLKRLLDSIDEQVKLLENVRLVVVNDGSHNGDYQNVVETYSDVVEYRILDKNIGPGLARQAAFDGAKENYLICIDDDCIAPDNWLIWLTATARANPEIDIFAGLTVPVWTQKANYFSKLFTVPFFYPRPIFSAHGLMTAVGANCMIKRTAFEKAGGYSTEIQGAVEDCCLTQSILNTGGTYGLISGGNLGHKASMSLKQIWRRFKWYGEGGAQLSDLNQYWQLAEMHTQNRLDNSYSDRFKILKEKVQAEWFNERHVKGQFVKKITYAFAVGCSALAYDLGWQKGVKKHTKKHGRDIPIRPSINDRFVDFNNEQELKKSLGQ